MIDWDIESIHLCEKKSCQAPTINANNQPTTANILMDSYANEYRQMCADNRRDNTPNLE